VVKKGVRRWLCFIKDLFGKTQPPSNSLIDHINDCSPAFLSLFKTQATKTLAVPGFWSINVHLVPQDRTGSSRQTEIRGGAADFRLKTWT
jgi:hypothetical protein